MELRLLDGYGKLNRNLSFNVGWVFDVYNNLVYNPRVPKNQYSKGKTIVQNIFHILS
jgi:hypothetical protein